MIPKQSVGLQQFNHFDPSMVHGNFPQVDMLQLSPGEFRGWVFSEKVGEYRINAGSSNQAILCEGRYNPEMIHIGFILNSGHSAIVQAHEFRDDTVAVYRGAIPMHEVLPAHMVWVDIFTPEKSLMNDLPGFEKQTNESPRILIRDSREDLKSLIFLINECLSSSETPTTENRIQALLKNLLSTRLDTQLDKRRFSKGDLFRMHLIEEFHILAQTHENTSLSLDEICTAVGMKSRTVQKIFQEVYGMGPTEYFRVRRLNGAYADLLGGSGRVSKVALRRQFNHLGRFAGRYKRHFGESPNTTLSRAKSEKARDPGENASPGTDLSELDRCGLS